MLILKDQFKVDDSDKRRIYTIYDLLNNRISGKFTVAECAEINQLWDKYPLDVWCDNHIAESLLQSEIRHLKGMSQRKEHAKLTMLIWLTELPARPSLHDIYNKLLIRESARRIYSHAYIFKR